MARPNKEAHFLKSSEKGKVFFPSKEKEAAAERLKQKIIYLKLCSI